MNRYKVFLCEPIHPRALSLLESRAELICDESRLCEIDAAVNRNLNMNREWLERCPDLKVIGIHGTGTDGVDLTAAAERGIKVCSAPGLNSQSVSELIAALALSLSRRLPQLDRSIRSGERCIVGGGPSGSELQGKVFGTLGCGRIGSGAARIMKQGFGMKAIGYSRSGADKYAGECELVHCASAEELFSTADIISVSVPLNDSTRNMVNDSLLSLVKPGAIFINTSRGAVVDEKALYRALTEGKLASAACDVFISEPPTTENPLVSLPNFLATPHIGANTDEALLRVGMMTVQNIFNALDGL